MWILSSDENENRIKSPVCYKIMWIKCVAWKQSNSVSRTFRTFVFKKNLRCNQGYNYVGNCVVDIIRFNETKWVMINILIKNSINKIFIIHSH